MIHQYLTIGNGRLMIWKTTEDLDDLKRELQNPVNLQEYDALLSDKRKKEFLAVRVALKKMLSKEEVIFYHSSGKPFLSKEHYNISISHSGCWVALFLHPDKDIGVDIELFRPKMEKLYTRFLNENEQSYLYEGNDISKVRITWSAKEVLYKIIGEEAVDFAAQLEIKPFDLMPEGEIKAEHLISKKMYNLWYKLNDDYVLVYCID